MVVIYIQKSWLSTIGDDIAELLLIRSGSDTCISLLGGKIKAGFPFVEAEIVRNPKSVSKDAFMPVHIPASVITGMFELTESEAEAYGFRPGLK